MYAHIMFNIIYIEFQGVREAGEWGGGELCVVFMVRSILETVDTHIHENVFLKTNTLFIRSIGSF